jgi:hypothetical protein
MTYRIDYKSDRANSRERTGRPKPMMGMEIESNFRKRFVRPVNEGSSGLEELVGGSTRVGKTVEGRTLQAHPGFSTCQAGKELI